MKTAIFRYKCRSCGEEYDDAHTSEENALMTLICTIQDKPMPSKMIGVQPAMVDIHSNCKKGSGVSDLMGYIIKEEENETGS